MPSKALTKWERKLVVGWDGEGANLPDGQHAITCNGVHEGLCHIYNLLGNSDGKHIVDHRGLSTEAIFAFFFKYNNRHAINVIFGGSYDVNMILRDVPPDLIRRLWSQGTCYWQGFTISYQNRKKFSVTRQRLNSANKYERETFTLWDVFGYFQCSFVTACRKWLGELDLLDYIERMKFQRSSFRTDDIDTIVRYNYAECKLLVNLIGSLLDSMDEAGIQLKRFDGAGSIAASLLKKYDVTLHKGYDEIPEDIKRLAQYAYSGGRIEAIKLGHVSAPPGYQAIHRYDINSAYPSAALSLRSYVGCEWDESDSWDGSDYSLAEVEFHYQTEAPYYPLWIRLPDGAVIYPREGHGIYWGYEIRLLKDYFQEGKDYTVVRAWNCKFAIDARPFQFIRQVYGMRRIFKERGSMAAEALKLGMNSIYGKLAQQVGYRNGKLPRYHHLLWAGQITSATRARLYRASRQNPGRVIAFATDAIIADGPLDLDTGNDLGQWTYESFSGITIVQAGVYWLRSDGGWYAKYRGFDNGTLIREDIIRCWLHGQDKYPARLTRFCGMGSAIGYNDFDHYWRQWITSDRELYILPTGKRDSGADTCYGRRLCATIPLVNINPEMLSAPYPLLWVEGHNEMRPKEEGIDIRVFERELEDSYA